MYMEFGSNLLANVQGLLGQTVGKSLGAMAQSCRFLCPEGAGSAGGVPGQL